MSAQEVGMRRAKLDKLHAEYLAKPPGSKEALKCEANWLKACREFQQLSADISREMTKQADLKERRSVLSKKHAEAVRKMAAEKKELEDLSCKVADSIMRLSFARKSKQEVIDDAAVDLARCTGGGPVQIEGRSYNFGCYGERVFLVPIARQSTSTYRAKLEPVKKKR